jgi:hypothetical protein
MEFSCMAIGWCPENPLFEFELHMNGKERFKLPVSMTALRLVIIAFI